MMNVLALCLVFTSLFAAEVWSPSPVVNKQPQNHQQVEDVIEKEGHRVIVVETYDQNGQHNTKVSISPEQPQPHHQQQKKQDGSKSPNMAETAKEKIKEASDVLPNLSQGVSPGSHYQESRTDGERHTPRELICDALGRCTHRIASVINKATGKISDAAHEAVAKEEEVVHEAKERMDQVYEKAKETASRKVHEAKETIEDVYEKAKDTATEKVRQTKEDLKETLHKAKDAAKSAKDIGKTIGKDVSGNITEVLEATVEKVKEEAKIKTKHTTNMISRFVRHVVSHEALSSLMGVVKLLGFAIAYGMCVWVTFVSSYVLAGALPRQQFGIAQSRIYPVYFTGMASSIALALLGHLVVQRRRLFTSKAGIFQAYVLLASFAAVLVNLLYLEPLATKAMFERMKIEKEEGRGIGSPSAESSEKVDSELSARNASRTEDTVPAAAPEDREKEEIRTRVRRTNKRIKTINSYSSVLNILTLMALTWHLVYLGECLHLREAR